MTPLTRKKYRSVRTRWTSVSSDKMTIADIEDNDVMKNGKVKFADADAKKSADTNAADARVIERGEKLVDEVKLLPHNESNVDKEDNGESEVDEMKFPDYDRMNFNW